MLFDSHTHLNFQAFDEDRDQVAARCREAKMLVMNVGAGYGSSNQAVDLSLQHDFCYASVGLHPIHLYDEEWNVAAYQALIDRGGGKVRAVGECGIDYWHIKRPDMPMDEIKAAQRNLFEAHIDLAQQNNLAVIIHGRNGKDDLTAYKTIYEIVTAKNVERAVVHCYGGDLDEARMFASLGYYIGFTGIVTFDKTGVLDDILRALKMEHILIETDAPYLTPVPHRGKRNEPAYVMEVARYIAKIKNMSVNDVVEITGQNACKLYGL